MKNKIIITLTIVAFLVVSVLFCCVSIERGESVDNYTLSEEKKEIEPEEEISELVDYEVKLTLFFEDSTSGILTKEERVVNAKELLDNPYMFTLNELLKGPKSTGLKSAIPEGTKINKAIMDNNTIVIDVSKEFLDSKGANAIYSIVNTMTEFNEIESVKITVDGEEKSGLKEKFIKIN